jgi:hypothetical protein
MKLVLKRVGDDPRLLRKYGDGRSYRDIPDTRPLALFVEGGEQLPCQISSSLISTADAPLRLTIVFGVDGNKISIQGDRKGVVWLAEELADRSIERPIE